MPVKPYDVVVLEGRHTLASLLIDSILCRTLQLVVLCGYDKR